ncbi:MAG: ATP-binding cassette domain-containing protein, partial [bacterium]
MAQNEIIIRFDDVSFDYGYNKPILEEACFSVAKGSKITFMGQNGAGKSTIFKLITGEFKPESGNVNIGHGLTIAIAKQV